MGFEGYQYTWLVVIFIVLFFGVRIAVGIWAGSKVKDAADYIVAGRRLPVYIAGASIMATWFAAETLMGASGTAYQYGFQGVIFDPFGATCCLFLSGFFFIRMMRKAKYITLVDFYERRFGKAMVVLATISQLATYFVWTGAQIVAGGTIINALFPSVPVQAGMIGVITFVTIYTTLGGMLADTLLDFMQMFLNAVGMTLIFLGMLAAVGGFKGLFSIGSVMYTDRPFSLLPTPGEDGLFQYLGYGKAMGWMYWMAAWLAVGLGSVPTQDLMQRSVSARNEATSVYGSYFAGILYGFFGIMSPLIGIMYYHLNPNLEDPQAVLILAAMEHLPPIMTAIFIAALCSALMSTSDSSLLAGASVVTENLIPVITGKRLGDKAALWWTRAMVVTNGVIGIIIALTFAVIYELGVVAWTLLLVGMFAPFAFGMYWKKANQTGAVLSYLGGFIAWALLTWFFYYNGIFGTESTVVICEGDFDCAFWDAVYIASFPAFVISLLLMWIGSLATQKIDPPKQLTDIDGNPIELKLENTIGWLPIRDALRKLTPEEIQAIEEGKI
ncbi:MAG: sodium:solute symporter family protein [Anaerolineae bacterium]|nr:sodium:solute symporter family protein [Anaerolineae bacterium]